MAIWYECGNGWVRTRGLARSNLGADVYLCCPGPSLAGVDAAVLNGPGRLIFAVTTAYPAVRPDVWIGTDGPECYDRRIWAEPFIKIVRGTHGGLRCQGRMLKHFPNVFFADLGDAPVAEILNRRGHDAVFVWNRNTFTTALHLAVWMGARRIHLVGCDFGGASDYHDGRRLDDSRRAGNRHLYANLVDDLRRLAPQAKARGIEITSCTPGSPANAFLPFLDLGAALARSAAAAPDRAAPVLHAADAELCRWKSDPPQARGVVAGFDAAGEWLVPWWYGCLRKHSDLPVAFADYGMSDAMRSWCAERGPVVDVTDVPVSVPRFRKPFAILRAPFRQVLALEPDCEVRGKIEPLFECCGTAAVGLAPAAPGHSIAAEAADGWFAMCTPQTVMWDSGIVAVPHGHDLVTEWAAETLANSGRYRNETEALALVIARGGHLVSRLPPELAFNRRRGADAGAAVYHWTGARGKGILRERAEVEQARAPLRAAGGGVRWARQPEGDMGILVPVCENQQDLVPWWWWAYARHNRWPVIFVDFGMNAATRRWCEARGRVMCSGAPREVPGWFRKPFAILKSPFRRTVWVDLDCEVRGDAARLASLAPGGMALGRDWSYPAALHHRLPFKGPCWSSALVAVEHGSPLVPEWARAVLEKKDKFRGDQEVLSALLHERKGDALAEIPLELLRSRQEGEDDGLVAMHWSGPGGKAAIRRGWSAIRAGVCTDMRAAFRRDWGCFRPTQDRGVIVGADESQEWLLEWWWANYSAHNGLPVLFVDFGLSAAARAWCVERGMLAGPTAVDCYGWFKKPLALLESPFRQAVWLDTDCEARGRLDPLFEFCGQGGIGLTLDRGTPKTFREAMPPDAPIYNSGVVAFNHGDPVVAQWASMTLALRSGRPGDTQGGQPGDQETLALTLRRYARGRIREVPKDLVRLRLSDGDGPALVMHWTGPDGKQHIKKALQKPAREDSAALMPGPASQM